MLKNLVILVGLALAACHGTTSQTPAEITAQCNIVVAGEKVDPGLVCFRDESILPTAIQFGDSVSKGYSIPARHDLCGVVDYRHDAWDVDDIDLCGESYNPYQESQVIDATSNDGYSTTLLQSMETQLVGQHYNVVLFNSGYHDVQHRLGRPVNVPEDAYRNNLEAIAQVCEQSADVCVWVDTPELGGAQSLPLANLIVDESNIVRYNNIAREVAKEHGFYMLTVSDQFHDGSAHFTSRGYAIIGSEVAECVLTALSQERTSDCHR